MAGARVEFHWQVQAAKQRFSELLRSAHDGGPQFVTRHGQEVAVVLDIDEYRRLTAKEPDFKEFLQSIPVTDVDFVRATDLPRSHDFSEPQ